MRELSSITAEKLAQRLITNSLAWAKTFLICVGRRDSSLEATLAEETLAYALCLSEERLGSVADETLFIGMVRGHCRRLQSERAWRSTNRHRRLPPASAAADASEFSRQYLMRAARADPSVGPTDETFEEFCRATGLSSSVLCGRSDNLAALVFYIVAHGCLSCRAPLSRRQTTELLRATRECRVHTESYLAKWMAGVFGETPAQRRTLTSTPPPQRLIAPAAR